MRHTRKLEETFRNLQENLQEKEGRNSWSQSHPNSVHWVGTIVSSWEAGKEHTSTKVVAATAALPFLQGQHIFLKIGQCSICSFALTRIFVCSDGQDHHYLD